MSNLFRVSQYSSLRVVKELQKNNLSMGREAISLASCFRLREVLSESALNAQVIKLRFPEQRRGFI